MREATKSSVSASALTQDLSKPAASKSRTSTKASSLKPSFSTSSAKREHHTTTIPTPSATSNHIVKSASTLESQKRLAEQLVEAAQHISSTLTEIESDIKHDEEGVPVPIKFKIHSTEPLLVPIHTQMLTRPNNISMDVPLRSITPQTLQTASRPPSPSRPNPSAIFTSPPRRTDGETVLPISRSTSPYAVPPPPIDEDPEIMKRQLHHLDRENKQLRMQVELEKENIHLRQQVGEVPAASEGVVFALVDRVKALEGEQRRAKARSIVIPVPRQKSTTSNVTSNTTGSKQSNSIQPGTDLTQRSDGFLKARVAQLESDCDTLREQLAASVASAASTAKQAQAVSANANVTNAMIEANAYDILQRSYHELSMKSSRQAKEMAAMMEQNEILRKENRRLLEVERELTRKVVSGGVPNNSNSNEDSGILVHSIDTEMARIKTITASLPPADSAFPLSDLGPPLVSLLSPLTTMRRLATTSNNTPVVSVLSDVTSAIATVITACAALNDESKCISDRIRRIKTESLMLREETDLTLRAIEDEKRMHVERICVELEGARAEILRLKRSRRNGSNSNQDQQDETTDTAVFDDTTKGDYIATLKQELEDWRADNSRLKNALALAEASGGVGSEAVLAARRARDDAESKVEDERLKNKKAAELVRTLKDEIARYKNGGQGVAAANGGGNSSDMAMLLRENDETQAKLGQLNTVLEEHVEQARQLKEENNSLRENLKRAKDKQKMFGRLEKEAKELEHNQIELVTALQDYERQYQAIIGLCSVTDPSILVEAAGCSSPQHNNTSIIHPHPRSFHPKFARLHQQYASAAHSLERATARVGELSKESELHGRRMAELAKEASSRGDEVVRLREDMRKVKEEVLSERDTRARLESRLQRIASGFQPLLSGLQVKGGVAR
ncbi:hypothetical protein SmJEL517_g04898 [Synchytrium microbalum]|uniref:Uncharacterized protein n=1 Tax=Synchytrium microbalum TaxID=1806994 RepID=A0A507C2S2_9FUNG|nr:uncharacterized protein SmJEL517_g04898 [Synchytrium microbalum]TPX31835.1 hypothetical protein SmJEL517_g04898 [Synchytrium microbalum]